MKPSASKLVAIGVVAGCFTYGLSKDHSSSHSQFNPAQLNPAQLSDAKIQVSTLEANADPSRSASMEDSNLGKAALIHTRLKNESLSEGAVLELSANNSEPLIREASKSNTSTDSPKETTFPTNPYEGLVERLLDVSPEERSEKRVQGAKNYLKLASQTSTSPKLSSASSNAPIATSEPTQFTDSSIVNGETLQAEAQTIESSPSSFFKADNPYVALYEALEYATEEDLLELEEIRRINMELYLSSVKNLEN